MNLLFLLLLIIAFFIFVPIPFRFNIHFSSDDYYIKFYGISLITKEKINNKKNKSSITKKAPPFKKNEKDIESKKELLLKKLKHINYKALISELYERKFKPVLYLDAYLSYSLSDAAQTAILYGALNNITAPIYILINIIFKFKKYEVKIDPLFKDEYFLDFDSDSIFFLSIAEIISIIAILFKYMRNSKEVAP
ncbi:MAG: DUF2953 domain-containing protein [Clostridium sp.]|nr:DUF2953 domain-containing protein [Clostridium sp.]